ncbi:glutathione peroxidase [Thermithiobacillus plumbiphilus]|uniref:Glutathione peroxidase n=1 Tax=Thermithiobacillus plumbiphilus TaxID=1729899 RepID=A0ABU9D849_9PROT
MLQSHEGQRVPDVIFHIRENNEWVDRSTDEIFNGRTVVVFGLPGAFTPTCSSSHVPRFNELAPAFWDNGVDEIICVSVNDTFVMNEWQKDQKAENVTFLPDGNGDFTAGMGMLVDKSDLGFGDRSWRYSMLVKDGVVEKMFIEPFVAGDPFEVSDADTMLDYINPRAKKPEFVFLFSKAGCPHCARAKTLLEQRGMNYEEAVVGRDVSSRAVRAATGKSTVPQIYIGGRYIGGSDDLEQYFARQG